MSEVIIVKAIETCSACPSQWDAWDLDGNYWYLRYRHSLGTAERQLGPDLETWQLREPDITFCGQDDDADGCISLERFCELAGLGLVLARAGGTPLGRDEIRQITERAGFGAVPDRITVTGMFAEYPEPGASAPPIPEDERERAIAEASRLIGGLAADPGQP